MSKARGRGLSVLSFSSLMLAAGTAVYAVVGHAPWLLALAAHLACLSALAQAEAWRVRVTGALLLCLGATTTAATTTALLTTRDQSAPTQQPLPPISTAPQWNKEEWPQEKLNRYRGVVDAQRDRARGVLRLRLSSRGNTTRHRMGARSVAWDLPLLGQHGVEIEWLIGGCTVPDAVLEHARGYNDVMVPAIREKFGAELFELMSHRLPPVLTSAKSSIWLDKASPRARRDDAFHRYVRRKLRDIQYCYEKQLEVAPDLWGTVLVEFEVLPEGAVTRWVTGKSEALSSCVAEAISSSDFPTWSSPYTARAKLPLTFHPADRSEPARSYGGQGWNCIVFTCGNAERRAAARA